MHLDFGLLLLPRICQLDGTFGALPPMLPSSAAWPLFLGGVEQEFVESNL